jgi:hypothetical protein
VLKKVTAVFITCFALVFCTSACTMVSASEQNCPKESSRHACFCDGQQVLGNLESMSNKVIDKDTNQKMHIRILTLSTPYSLKLTKTNFKNGVF